MASSVLIVAAHPDDEVLGCGGTIAKLTRAGQRVSIAILGEGITSRVRHRAQANPADVDTLQQCARAAAKVLGAQDVTFHQLPDNRFDTVPLLDIIKIVEDLIERLSPAIVYTHGRADLNVDHRLTHDAVLTATRPIAGQPVRELYTFEVASSTEWAFSRIEPAFRPSVFVDIASTLDTKLRALACYDTEIRAFPHPRSPDTLRAMAARWGSTVGCHAAEAFESVRVVR